MSPIVMIPAATAHWMGTPEACTNRVTVLDGEMP
jgi:hypothetical protein